MTDKIFKPKEEEEIKGGKGNEPWYMSRRMWSVVFMVAMSIIAALVEIGIIPQTIYTAFSPLLGLIGAYLGVRSWIKPKAK